MKSLAYRIKRMTPPLTQGSLTLLTNLLYGDLMLVDYLIEYYSFNY
jgi:hypothetical protein